MRLSALVAATALFVVAVIALPTRMSPTHIRPLNRLIKAAQEVCRPPPKSVSASAGSIADEEDTDCYKVKREEAEMEEAAVCPMSVDGTVIDTAFYKVKRSAVPSEGSAM